VIKNQAENEAAGLENAPEHVKLAVDLIYLLESHELDKETILKALEIVKQDFSNKPRSNRTRVK